MRLSLSGRWLFGAKARTVPAAGDILPHNLFPSLKMAASGGVTCEHEGRPSSNRCGWAGRLDYSERTADSARFRGPGTEGAVALELYRSQGCAGLRHLIGDWSLAIWDAGEQAIVLASDYAGIIPIYYRINQGSLRWASSLEEIVEVQAGNELSADYAAAFIGDSPESLSGLTPFENIYVVPPGQAAKITCGRVEVARFWRFPVSMNSRLRDESEYSERLLYLFEEAVKARVRSARSTVLPELSGGLDSTAIAHMTQRVLVDAPAPAPRMVTLSYDQHRSNDDTYIRLAQMELRTEAIHLRVGGDEFLCEQLTGNTPLFWEGRLNAVAETMNQHGSTLLLTGQLGDLTMGNWADDSEQVGDLLSAGRWMKGISDAFAWSRWLRVPVYSVLGRGLRASLPRPFRGANRSSSGNNSLSKRILEKTQSAACSRDKEQQAWLAQAAPTRRKRLIALESILDSGSLACPEPLLRSGGAWAHPFAHRPLVEFALSIPPEVMCRPGQSRRLMRHAFRGLLPSSILQRRSKGTFTQIHQDALRPIARSLLLRPNDIKLLQMGYVERDSLIRRLNRLVDGLECNEPQLRRIVLLETWMRRPRIAARTAAVTGDA